MDKEMKTAMNISILLIVLLLWKIDGIIIVIIIKNFLFFILVQQF